MKKEDHKKEIELLLHEKYKGEKTPEFEKDVIRVEKGEPIDYVIGFVPFLETHIDLSHLPLIPRTETEFWVEDVIKKILSEESNEQMRCLDAFSGSGCIGIALLKHIPNIKVDFAEKDPYLVEQINKNIEINHIDSARVNVLQSDIFETIHEKYNHIFANPPYIAKKRIDSVAESVLEWEPSDALFAQNDGLFFIEKILQESPTYLKEGGFIHLEFDAPQKEELEELLQKYPHFESEFYKDQFDNWRAVHLLYNT